MTLIEDILQNIETQIINTSKKDIVLVLKFPVGIYSMDDRYEILKQVYEVTGVTALAFDKDIGIDVMNLQELINLRNAVNKQLEIMHKTEVMPV